MRESAIELAIGAGIRYMDTSSEYADAERRLGFRAKEICRLGIRICTKAPAVSGVRESMGKSLDRIGLPAIDTFLIHSASLDEIHSNDVAESLAAEKSAGRVRRTGASTYGAVAAVAALEQPWCDVVQVEHNILNPSVVKSLAGHKRPDQEIVVRSVLCKGLLTSRRRNAVRMEKSVLERIDRLELLGSQWGYALPELSIRFALDTPGVDVVLVGVSSPEEVTLAMSAFDRPPLMSDQMDELSGFACPECEWSHPERWPAMVA